MSNTGTLVTVASIIAGFGVAMLFFRINRELEMGKRGEPIWIPYSDWLLICATLASLLLVIFPIVGFNSLPGIIIPLPSAACAAATIMVSGYVFGILAHYRLIFGRHRKGKRVNPEPSEKVIVWMAFILSIAAFVLRYFKIF